MSAYIAAAGELKTKPTQHSVKELLAAGIQPDLLLCRSDRDIPADARRKIGLFCNIRQERVIPAIDVLLLGLPVANAEHVLSYTFPPGIPSGTQLWHQHWVSDFTGPFGYTASNALLAITP